MPQCGQPTLAPRKEGRVNDERTPALRKDWKQPQRDLLEREWRTHSQHEQLVELSRERDEGGEPTWELHEEPDPDAPDWTVVWFRPLGLRDERPSIRVHRYPNAWLKDELAHAEDLKAIDDEHQLD
jgi:hypothetical protein